MAIRQLAVSICVDVTGNELDMSDTDLPVTITAVIAENCPIPVPGRWIGAPLINTTTGCLCCYVNGMENQWGYKKGTFCQINGPCRLFACFSPLNSSSIFYKLMPTIFQNNSKVFFRSREALMCFYFSVCTTWKDYKPCMLVIHHSKDLFVCCFLFYFYVDVLTRSCNKSLNCFCTTTKWLSSSTNPRHPHLIIFFPSKFCFYDTARECNANQQLAEACSSFAKWSSLRWINYVCWFLYCDHKLRKAHP